MKVKDFLISKDYEQAEFVLAFGVDNHVVDLLETGFGSLDIIEIAGLELGCISVRIPVAQSIPQDYTRLEGALTAPLGYEWYSNGNSRFKRNDYTGKTEPTSDRVTILVKNDR